MISLYVNDFIIKETRQTLKALHISQEKKNFQDYKNDIPILTGAVFESADLANVDGALRDDTKGLLKA